MWTQYDSGFENETEKSHGQPSDSLSRIGQIVNIVVGISAIVTAIAAAKGGPTYLVWILVGVAVLLFVSTTYKPVAMRIHLRSERRKDEQVARDNWKELRNLVHRFGDFVSTQNSNTLHYIIMHDISDPTRTRLSERIVSNNLFYGFWHSFMRQIDREPISLAELAYAVEEFYHLVGQYNNYCIEPIFERLSPDLRQQITEEMKTKLNTFRERYGHFGNDFMAFGKQFSESRPQLQRLPHYVHYPTQL